MCCAACHIRGLIYRRVFARQRDKYFCGFPDLNEYFIVNSLLHSQVQIFTTYNVFGCFFLMSRHSRAAILGKVSSAIAEYQLYSSNMKYKPNSAPVEYKL
jgi:hypothetical protein